MRSLVCAALLVLAVAGLAPQAKAADTDVYSFALASLDTVYQDVPKEFTGVRVWVKNGRGTTQPGLRVYRTAQRGWGKAVAWEKSPVNMAYFTLRRSGSQAVLAGQWNEYPFLEGSAFTLYNYTALPETLLVEVVR